MNAKQFVEFLEQLDDEQLIVLWAYIMQRFIYRP